MGEWRYSSTILDLSIRWRSVVSFTLQSLYPRGKAPGTHWTRGWVGPRGGLDVVEKVKILPLPQFEPRTSSLQLAAIRTELSGLLPDTVTNAKYIILT
jgi:hypothetical protein